MSRKNKKYLPVIKAYSSLYTIRTTPLEYYYKVCKMDDFTYSQLYYRTDNGNSKTWIYTETILRIL